MNEDQTQTSAAWGDAAVICPWIQYLCYGDDRLLAEQYDSMKAWVDYIKGQGAEQHLWNTGFHFGDWLGLDAKENSYVGATPLDMVATSFFACCCRKAIPPGSILLLRERQRFGSIGMGLSRTVHSGVRI
ncbi:hypothetical protein J2T20_004787 [Paenibacillus wynnii]|nr:hypothetical protein [Paenibacillus wynnii]